MLKRLFATLVLTGFAVPAAAADFGFQVIIQAGLPGNLDTELGIGAPGSPSVAAHMLPYWGNNTPQRFEIGYQEATGNAFVRVFSADGTSDQAVYTPVGALPLNPTGTWTFSNLYVTATNFLGAASIRAENLTLSSGLDVVQPLTTTSLAAVADGSQTVSSPVVFRTYQNGGDWMVSGTIAMSGIFPYSLGAWGSMLQFGLTAEADIGEVPEPSYWPVFLLLAVVLGARAARRDRCGRAI